MELSLDPRDLGDAPPCALSTFLFTSYDRHVAAAAPAYSGAWPAPARVLVPQRLHPDVPHDLPTTRGETRDPTGVVRPDVDGELQALRTYEKIIHEHPDWSSEQVDQELVSTIYTTKRRERLQAAYRWVEHTLELFINRQPEHVFTAGEKKQLIARLRKTELQLPPPVAAYADEPDLFTKNDVFYERTLEGRMRMRVGGAYLHLGQELVQHRIYAGPRAGPRDRPVRAARGADCRSRPTIAFRPASWPTV